jgi:hypothetical protein
MSAVVSERTSVGSTLTVLTDVSATTILAARTTVLVIAAAVSLDVRNGDWIRRGTSAVRLMTRMCYTSASGVVMSVLNIVSGMDDSRARVMNVAVVRVTLSFPKGNSVRIAKRAG